MTSGKFIVRIPTSLHASLKKEAEVQAISLNDLCIKRLSETSFAEALPLDIATAVGFLTSMCQQQLVGIVIFGSWARGDANALSDVDILVVLSQKSKITRDLYRKWENCFSEPTRIEPHFARLPDLHERVSGLWAEIAMDGLILSDRRLKLHHYLTHIRHLIAAGKIVAKRSHGQNYWVHTGVA